MESKNWIYGILTVALAITVFSLSCGVAYACDDNGENCDTYNSSYTPQYNYWETVNNYEDPSVPPCGWNSTTIYCPSDYVNTGAGAINAVYTASFELGQAPAGVIGSWAYSDLGGGITIDSVQATNEADFFMLDGCTSPKRIGNDADGNAIRMKSCRVGQTTCTTIYSDKDGTILRKTCATNS